MSEPAQATTAAAEERTDAPSAPGSPQPAAEEKPETKTTATKERDDDEHETDETKESKRSQSDDEEPTQEDTSAPPLPDEVPPPLPKEAPPGQAQDDGWEPVWDANIGAYYFYNRFTGQSQWDNPRVPNAEAAAPPPAPGTEAPKEAPVLGGYNPAIHGDYDPNASYAQEHEPREEARAMTGIDPMASYAATGAFNRFTGRWQAEGINPDNHSQHNKAHRQMNAFFDVDAAANSHDGRSLRAERSAKKLTKKELKMFKEKRREKKEEKRRAWLRD